MDQSTESDPTTPYNRQGWDASKPIGMMDTNNSEITNDNNEEAQDKEIDNIAADNNKSESESESKSKSKSESKSGSSSGSGSGS
jgi:hypothetical protein